MQRTTNPHPATRVGEWLAVAVAYVVGALLSQTMGIEPRNVTAVWLPTGLLLAWVRLRGPSVWPGIILGAGFSTVWAYATPELGPTLRAVAVAGATGLGDVVTILGGAALLRRFGPSSAQIESARAAAVFILGPCLLAPLAGALFGVGGLVVFDHTAGTAAEELFIAWWISSGVGALLVAPAVLAWRDPPEPAPGAPAELGSVVLVTVGLLALSAVAPAFRSLHVVDLLLLLGVLWSAVRFSARVTFGLTALAGGVEALIWAAQGSYADLKAFQVFAAALGMAAVTITATVATARRLRRRLEAQLEAGDAELALRGAAIEAAGSAIVVTGPDGRVHWANPAFASLAGESRAGLVGQVVPRVEAWASLAPGQVLKHVVPLERADGSPYVVEETVTAIAAADGGVGHFVVVQDDLTQLLAERDKLRHLANHDPLTGLPNRSVLMAAIDEALADARRRHEGFAVHLLDLDHFKDVNDALGHPAGDALLVSVARRLQSVLRETDRIARLGGDEFAIVQRGISEPAEAAVLARRLLAELGEPFDWRGHQIRSGGSVGICVVPGDGTLPAGATLEAADVALYAAKGTGRGRYAFHEPSMTRAVRARLALSADLGAALDAGALRLAWQPQWDLQTGQLVGLELLSRWPDAARGSVPPAEFIPAALRAGLIHRVGEHALEGTCAFVARRLAEGRPTPRVGINFSPVELSSPGFAARVEAALRAHGVPGEALEFEITEGAFSGRSQVGPAVVDALAELGVRFALDDFGTGFSSLHAVGRLKVQRLKVPVTIVGAMQSDPRDEAVVQATIDMGHALGLTVVAEGVEHEHTRDRLAEMGCDVVQGYLTGAPMDRAAIEALLDDPGTDVLAISGPGRPARPAG